MPSLTTADLQAIEREYCKRSLSNFTQRAWRHIDPQGYVHGWHMDALSDHLMACASGEIKRLLINVPPGTSKSSISCVYFPAWLWGPANWPSARFISASHEQGLAVRDNRRGRQLVESAWYQELWPVKFAGDQNEKTYFENTQRGFRQASAVKSMTGRRGDIVVWDDPLSPEKAYSETDRETANRVFAETLPTRLVDPENSAIIIIMQRLHESDVSGYILARNLGYEHLCLPMEYEPSRKCVTSIGFEDPRTEPGELLFEARFPRQVVDRDKSVMGSFAVAGQFQQRPVPRDGGLFKREWFRFLDSAPEGLREVRAWDLAGSDRKKSPYTAGVKIGKTVDGHYVVLHAKRAQTTLPRKMIKETAQEDGVSCFIDYPQDPGQAGKDQKQSIAADLSGYRFASSPETGSKVTRAEPFAAQAEAGNVYLLRGAWNAAYLDELCTFPSGQFADQVDASSRGFNRLFKLDNSTFSWFVNGQHIQ